MKVVAKTLPQASIDEIKFLVKVFRLSMINAVKWNCPQLITSTYELLKKRHIMEDFNIRRCEPYDITLLVDKNITDIEQLSHAVRDIVRQKKYLLDHINEYRDKNISLTDQELIIYNNPIYLRKDSEGRIAIG